MFTTLVAIFCIGAAKCEEAVVTDSNMSEITMMSCALGAQAGIAKWMGLHPKYHSWRLEKYRCIPGPYTAKHDI